MKTIGQIVVFSMLIIALIGGILVGSWVVQGNEFFLYKYFAPKQEAVRREVFEQTKSYKQGMVQELQNMQFQYVQATAEQKGALKSIILHRSADFPTEDMPTDLRSFIQSLKSTY